MPTISNYRYFIEIARDMNLETTSSRMYITHQGLSRHLRMLEKHYGVKLVKSSPRFMLTEDGKWLLQQARKIVDVDNHISDYFDRIADMSEAEIRVACRYPRIRNIIFDASSKFSEHHPNVKVTYVRLDAEERLPESESDIDLLISNSGNAHDDFISREFLPNYGYLIVSRKYLRRMCGENINMWLEKIKDGIELSEFPSISKISRPEKGDKLWWMSSFYPELENIERINADGERPEEILKMCSMGQCVMIVSQLYWDNVERMYSKSFIKELICFPLLKNGKRICKPEYIYWPKNLVSRQNGRYTSDFIRVLEGIVNPLNAAEI